MAWIFMVWLFGVLPWLALQSAQALRRQRTDPRAGALPPRTRIFASSVVMLMALFLLSWFTARKTGPSLFAVPHLGTREVVAGIVTFLFYLVLRQVSRALRTEQERRRMPVYALLPRTGPEWGL